jgi:nucleotide-binding universal stress UspA family protein
MPYRTILVELATERRAEANLPTALALAGRFEAALVAMHVIPPPFVPLAWEGGASVYIEPQLLEAQRQAAIAMRDRVEAVFQRLAGAEARARWVEAEGDAEQLLATAGHAADLVVTAGSETAADVGELAERLIMNAGVPVLVLPPRARTDLGRTVLVGWNGKREAARAVHEALPFLAAAERVPLVAVGEQAVASLEDAAAMLRRHGVAVEPVAIAEPDGHAGEVLLAQAGTHRADLLVMGAYGHARLRELVFGGATRHVLREAGLPVLFGC